MTVPDRVCVVVGRTRHKMMQAELLEAAKRGAKFVEVRLDFLAKAVDFNRLAAYKQCPWMATIRRPADGGRWAGTEADRLTVLRQAIASGLFDWVDLETDIAGGIRRFGSVKRVVSYHNIRETPADLAGIADAMHGQDADVVKIAVLAKTPADCKAVLDVQRGQTRPTVAFGMGDVGFPTRLLNLKYGAPWTYAAFNRERGVAPGLPSVDDFRTTYPVGRIGPATEFFALLGDPVAQSHSPVLHNRAFTAAGRDAVYVPWRVPAGKLPEAVAALADVPMSGYSVTIPHKEAAFALAATHDPAAASCQAVNTLVRRADGSFAGFNTDYTAAADSLRAHLADRPAGDEPRPELAKLFVLILGAGGAARAVAAALHAAGAAVTVTSRSADKARALAAAAGVKSVEWEARHAVLPLDVVVNCTPVGMHPKPDESPVHVSILRPGMTVFDTVYNPENTKLIKDARQRGCFVVTGVDMFVRQAARQSELFTGDEPNLELMRDLLRKAMSPLTAARTADEDAA